MRYSGGYARPHFRHITFQSRTPADMTFTQDRELEAAKIGRQFKDRFASRNPSHTIGNDARIWNNPRWMFDNPIRGKPVLVGVHIGGSLAVVGTTYNAPDDESPCCERTRSSPDKPCNKWICGIWDKEGTTAQEKMLRVFDSLFGPGYGREVLLATPSFDACPVRANEADQIPTEMWRGSMDWFYSVLEHLRPSLIICNRNTEPGGRGKSAWSALLDKRDYDVRPKRPYTEIHGTGSLKSAEVMAGPLTGTKVIGLPQLTYWGTDILWTELRKLGAELSLR